MLTDQRDAPGQIRLRIRYGTYRTP